MVVMKAVCYWPRSSARTNPCIPWYGMIEGRLFSVPPPGPSKNGRERQRQSERISRWGQWWRRGANRVVNDRIPEVDYWASSVHWSAHLQARLFSSRALHGCSADWLTHAVTCVFSSYLTIVVYIYGGGAITELLLFIIICIIDDTAYVCTFVLYYTPEYSIIIIIVSVAKRSASWSGRPGRLSLNNIAALIPSLNVHSYHSFLDRQDMIHIYDTSMCTE